MTARIIVAPTLADAQAWVASQGQPGLTVEAEYGATVIEGRLYTAAHHQPAGSPYAGDHVVEGGRPSPCIDPNIPQVREGDILLSHLDLDSIGGVLYGSCGGCDLLADRFVTEEELVRYGKEYLGAMRTLEQAIEEAGENIDWDLEAIDMVLWVDPTQDRAALESAREAE